MIKKVCIINVEAKNQHRQACRVLVETYYLLGFIPVYRREMLLDWS